MMNLFRKITDGVTDESIYKRIGWMYASFFLLFVSVSVLSYFLLPEGILRGKDPIVRRLNLSSNVWVSTLQIFGANLSAVFVIIVGNLFAHHFSKNRSLPLGYFAFWWITVKSALYLGTWSQEVITVAPPLYVRFLRFFDIVHHAGLLELSAYLLAATVSFKFTLLYTDGKREVDSRSWRDVTLTTSEKILLALAFVLVLCGAFIESYGIVQLTG
jgi:uncharacterized membrane protein SpoIIM required for sporulation